MENFLQNQRGDVFTGVALLIYVFDIESRDFPRDLETFTTVLEALYDGSPDARLFCLFHKMDLVQEELRESLFNERETILRQISHMFTYVAVLGTSIWDETLYKVRFLERRTLNVGVVFDRAVTDTEYGCYRITSGVLLRIIISRGSRSFRTDYFSCSITHLAPLTRPNPRPTTIRKSLLHHKKLQTKLRVLRRLPVVR